jgi:cation diffusion facilitator family transporter
MQSPEAVVADPVITREKQNVALLSVVAAGILAALKFGVGAATGSLGILSEGAHSGLDLIAAAITYFSVRVSDLPADSSHPFGHGKVEHLSAFIETALLFATCAWIVVEAMRRLLFHLVRVEPSVWAFAIMAVSIATDVYRSKALFRVARKYQSEALEADAIHFSTDIYSSSAVILGLAMVVLSEHWGIPWLRNADTVAALVVAAVIVRLSLRLARKTVNALVDAAPEGAAASIAGAVSRVEGVIEGDRIRVRQSGNRLFVDLRLTLESNIPFEHAQAVMDLAEARVRDLFPMADVMVHAAPRQPQANELVEKIRAVAHRRNFQVHDVTAFNVGGRVSVNLDLEVEPDLSLEKAHDEATCLEQAIKEETPEVDEVNVHLEPLLRRVEPAGVAVVDVTAIERKLLEIATGTPGVLDCHSVRAHWVAGSLLVQLHCTMEPRLPIGQVHAITEDLEFRFREAFPQISKVSIHAEPAEDSSGPPAVSLD